ncbi:MAG: response regulator [Syntrophobacteraceae bacterium]|jgi:CheY-like chemotaxis protein
MPQILVIDDDLQTLFLLREMLDQAGYGVLVAPDGKEGIRVCESTRVDLVITDVFMPEMEGLAVIMALRREFPDIKIIAVSGGGRIGPKDYLIVAGKLGANRTFTKPFGCNELLDAVKELVG